MSNKKYDIPYSLKPSKKGKKSKYASYIEDNDTFANRFLSSPGKKLLAYIIFFAIFAYVFISALRGSKHPESVDYELDLEFSNNRKKNLIDETILDSNDDNYNDNSVNSGTESNIDSIDIEIDTIDLLDSDEGELPLGSNDEKSEQNLKKKNKNNNKINDKNAGKFDNDANDELSDQISSGNEKLNANKAKWDKINLLENKKREADRARRNKKIVDEQLIDEVDKMERLREKGRNKNAIKGEEI